ncbi:MAG: SDR family NAD(P)-dependent oxidoreductase [Paracoccaceae bacterium]
MGKVLGRIALVTGAGSAGGIGFATARALALGGARVVLTSTTDRIFDRLADLQTAAPGDHAAYIADLTDPAQTRALIRRLRAQMGGLDIVVNNAGMVQQGRTSRLARIEKISDDDWQRALAINLTTAFNVSRAALPGLQKQGRGRIVNVASVTGPLVSITRTAGYSAAKAGMVGLTRATAIENARFGITCNAVLPGWIDTASASAAERRAGKATPAGRCGTPAEVAAACLFLASDAASYITGTTLVVDGGNTIVEEKGAGF